MSPKLTRIPIEVSVSDITKIKGELNRLTAPLTVGTILKILPINGRAHRVGATLSIILGIQKGIEKPVNFAKAGTIAYWPKGDSLQIYLNDSKTQGQINKVGEVKGDLNCLMNTKLSLRLKVRLI